MEVYIYDMLVKSAKKEDHIGHLKEAFEILRYIHSDTRAGGHRLHMENIICRFGIPKEISCDNGPQFIGKRTTKFFEKWYIKRILSTPYHRAANGQAESSNKVILNILKKKLEEAKGLWPELLPEVLWAYRTTPKPSIRETPYSLVYETDVVIPVEVGEPSLRYSNESATCNDESRLQDLDEVEE
ncbi:uncharacterized protein LOC142174540 [Nicotiana tabacum]|uniref:Uncharacterized protein LOC142174540 n=1 Tax=Nicotiana tabacum TaxID=4097 RepID=A0AC58TGV4_TOBAC